APRLAVVPRQGNEATSPYEPVAWNIGERHHAVRERQKGPDAHAQPVRLIGERADAARLPWGVRRLARQPEFGWLSRFSLPRSHLVDNIWIRPEVRCVGSAVEPRVARQR